MFLSMINANIIGGGIHVGYFSIRRHIEGDIIVRSRNGDPDKAAKVF